MSDDPRPPVLVQLDPAIPPGEEAELREALAEAGFDMFARDMPKVRGADTINAVALLMIPLHAFLAATGSKLAAEAYPKFKAGIRRILNRQPANAGVPAPLVVQDTTTGLKIVMERDLPDEAYEALQRLDLTTFRQGPIDWDRLRGRWRSLADETA